MPKIRVSIEGFYEVDPAHYHEGANLADMAEIDANNVQNDPIAAVCIADPDTIQVVIEPWSYA